MSIIGKTNHPVQVKRISMRIWTLRNEIEAAIAQRVKECESNDIPLFIDDIKAFYNPSFKAEFEKSRADSENEETSNENPESEEAQPEGEESEESSAAESEAEGKEEESSDDATDEESSEESEESEEATEASEESDSAEEIASEVLSEENKEESLTRDDILNRPFERPLPNSDLLSYGFSLLSDISMNEILIFGKDSFTHGQTVMLEFLIPKKFLVCGEVYKSVNIAQNSRVISDSKPNYRLQIKYLFAWPGERGSLRSFLKSVEPDIPAPPKKKKVVEDDDDLSDLDF